MTFFPMLRPYFVQAFLTTDPEHPGEDLGQSFRGLVPIPEMHHPPEYRTRILRQLLLHTPMLLDTGRTQKTPNLTTSGTITDILFILLPFLLLLLLCIFSSSCARTSTAASAPATPEKVQGRGQGIREGERGTTESTSPPRRRCLSVAATTGG